MNMFEALPTLKHPPATDNSISASETPSGLIPYLDQVTTIWNSQLAFHQSTQSILADQMTHHVENPLCEKLKTLGHPILTEQLVHLSDICALCKRSDVQYDKQIIQNFALEISHIALKKKHSHPLTQDLITLIGKMIFLTNQDFFTLYEAIEPDNISNTLLKINQLFTKEVQLICNRLKEHYCTHKKTLLQSPEAALNTRIPIEIAQALITKNGKINIGIISLLRNIFISTNHLPINHEINLSYTLQCLQTSPNLCNALEKIHAPRQSSMPANHIIRCTLGLAPNVAITDIHARQVALAALLSHLRQGRTTSCFASSHAIHMLSGHLEKCLQDFSQLLSESKLTRIVNNTSIDFPIIVQMGSTDLDKSITFDAMGILWSENLQTDAHLSEAPGLRAAFKAIGIEDYKHYIKIIIEEIFQGTQNKQETRTVKQLLQSICLVASKLNHQESQLGFLYSKACYAFGSQLTHPLFPAWVNTIAGMAEARESGMIKTAIINTVGHSLGVMLGKLGEFPHQTRKNALAHFTQKLAKKIHLHYDPTLIHEESLIDQDIKEGGFVLYHYQMQKSIRIDHPKKFQYFLNEILETSSIETELSKKIKKFIFSEDGMLHILRKYHPSNESIQSLHSNNELLNLETAVENDNVLKDFDLESRSMKVDHSKKTKTTLIESDYSSKNCINLLSSTAISKLKYTPWITLTGNDSKAVLETYLEYKTPIKSEIFIPKMPIQLLTKIIDFGKALQGEEKETYLKNLNYLTPIRILGTHTFSLMLGHPTLMKIWKDKQHSEERIDKYLIQPGLKIANTPIEERMKTTLIDHIVDKFIPQSASERLINTLKKLPKEISIKNFRNACLKICTQISPEKTAILSKRAREFDTILCHTLPKNLKKTLYQSCIHFADTNWFEGAQDIHYAFAINPGTGDLEIWQIYANGTHLVALDQRRFLLNQEWELFSL